MQLINPLHILCFGDSITAGWYWTGPEWHPYAYSLVESLTKSYPSLSVDADVQGLGGDRVISPPGVYFPRMTQLYEHSSLSYDWAIILGGTNDLATNREPDEIWEALQKVWEIPLSNNTKVLALSVPECGVCDPIQTPRRDKLNNYILNHKAKNFYTYDLHAAFPYWNLTEERRKELWDDGVHPNDVGYDLIGNLLAERLRELIPGSEDADGKDEDQELPRNELKARRGASL